MSIQLITGTLQGNTVTGTFGQILALTDSDILVTGLVGNQRFTLPKGTTFGAVALNGSTPFPNDIYSITAYGQSQVLAFETQATGGGGGAGFTAVSQSATFPYTVTFYSGSSVLSSYTPTGAASASFVVGYLTTASFNAISSSFVNTASFNSFTSSIVSTSSLNELTSSLVNTASFNDLTASVLYTSSLVSGPGITINQSGSNLVISSSALIDTASIFANQFVIGNSYPTNTGNWRIVTSASALNFEYWDDINNVWITDTYFDGTPFTGSGNVVSASYALTASYVEGALVTSSIKEGPGIIINAVGNDLFISSSATSIDTSSFITTASFNPLTASYVESSASFSASINAINNWTSSAYTGSVAGFATTSSVLEVSASISALSASYLASSASFSASIADLYTGSGGGAPSTDTLQDVTTRGNQTTSSINIGFANFINSTSSLVVGSGSVASADFSFAQGIGNGINQVSANGVGSHAEGNSSTAVGVGAHAEGLRSVAIGDQSHAEGEQTTAIGIASHTEGFLSTAVVAYSHAEGEYTITLGVSSHAEGNGTITLSDYSHAEGMYTSAVGTGSHAEGSSTTAVGDNSHAEGTYAAAIGIGSHAEGNSTMAMGDDSHAEGGGTTAIGGQSHAEGGATTAIGIASHTEGSYTTAVGDQSHAEGQTTIAIGQGSHAEGKQTTAIGQYSHAEGEETIAAGFGQHVEGKYNLEDVNALWIVGDGASAAARSNLIAAYTNKVTITGSLEVNGINVSASIADLYTGSGGGASGVSQIIAGTNISVSPAGGTGIVTINATNGGLPSGSGLLGSASIFDAYIDSSSATAIVNTTSKLSYIEAPYLYGLGSNTFQGNTTIRTFIAPNLLSMPVGGATAGTFYNSGIQYIKLDSLVSSSLDMLRNVTSLKTIDMPNLQDASANQAFNGCSGLISVNLPLLQKSGQSIFNGCSSLPSISLPSIITLGNNSFQNCTLLVSASLPNAVTLGSNTFSGCTNLGYVEISNVTSLGANTFSGCANLTSINLPSLVAPNGLGGSPLANAVFNGVPDSGSITIPLAFATNNAGGPDGDLVFLTTAPKNWTINYI